MGPRVMPAPGTYATRGLSFGPRLCSRKAVAVLRVSNFLLQVCGTGGAGENRGRNDTF